jgi:hypothetical protein
MVDITFEMKNIQRIIFGKVRFIRSNQQLPSMIDLDDSLIFSSGGNRICYVHPKNKERCLKICRADRTPQLRRSQKPFPANLRPLSFFDENKVERDRLDFLFKNYPSTITSHLSKSHGIVSTSMGPAHETDLIRDHDGKIAQSLEQYLWQHGLDDIAESAIAGFIEDWTTSPPKTRDLIPHNMAIQLNETSSNLVLIDGLGRMPAIRFFKETPLRPIRLKKRLIDLQNRVDKVIIRKIENDPPLNRINNLNRLI